MEPKIWVFKPSQKLLTKPAFRKYDYVQKVRIKKRHIAKNSSRDR
jgi:hypothetical protein